MRSYDEYCAIAKSLDVVGDRWALLIVRELALRGSSRYTDLRNGLPGIASNLLAERLRELERAGVITREDAPPPVATALYRLAPRGEELRPVLDALFHWGMALMSEQKPTDVVRSHWLAGALGSILEDRQPDGPPATIALEIGDQAIVLELRAGAIHVELGRAPAADLTLTGPPQPVMGLVLGRLPLEAADGTGVGFRGDIGVLERIQPGTSVVEELG